GFEVRPTKESVNPDPSIAKSDTSSGAKPAAPPSKIKLTSRAASPSREIIAFARGVSPMLRSSAPLVFASSDEKASPVRFNDKPFRGKLEVVANTHGTVTVVNVIGLADYAPGDGAHECRQPHLEASRARAE